MSRELVRVPPNYEHPRIIVERWNGPRWVMKPTFHHTSYEDALSEFEEKKARVGRGELDKYEECYRGKTSEETIANWLEDHSAPEKDWYRNWKVEDATWFQLWQTVTEGGPVSPAFETKEELVEYLVRYGDEFYDEEPRIRPWARDYATDFIMGVGWKPSGAFIKQDGVMIAQDDPVKGERVGW